MTLNPAAAHGLEGCTSAQIKLGTNEMIECPAGSEIGTVVINAPGIPDGSLAGKVYLGSPEPGGAESGEEFRIFLAAEAPQYGVGLRLEGHVKANVQTGRLTAIFTGDPQLPFEDFILTFRGGPTTPFGRGAPPLANPLRCGLAEPAAALTPYTGQPAQAAQTHGFAVDANGKGGSCPAPLPFAPAQTTPPQSPARAGAYSPFTLQLARGEGQQYLAKAQTTLPPGLLGAIPSVPLCGEAQANAGTCPAASEIGTASVSAGAGPEPYGFAGKVLPDGPLRRCPLRPLDRRARRRRPLQLWQRGHPRGHRRRPVQRPRDRHRRAAEDRGRRPAAAAQHQRDRQPTQLPVQPHQLLPARHRIAARRLRPRLRGAHRTERFEPLPGGRMQQARVHPEFTAATGARVSRVNGAGLEVKVTQAAHQSQHP